MRVRVKTGEYAKFRKEVDTYWIKRSIDEVLFHMFWKIRKLELKTMDKQIAKVKKDVVKGDKKKAKKDIKKLQKMDKKMDKKVAKCSKMAKGKKK
jgi:hypothetical protein